MITSTTCTTCHGPVADPRRCAACGEPRHDCLICGVYGPDGFRCHECDARRCLADAEDAPLEMRRAEWAYRTAQDHLATLRATGGTAT